MKILLEPIDKYTLDYIFATRLNKDTTNLNVKRYRSIFLKDKDSFKTILIDDKIIGVIGFLSSIHGLCGYLVLTNNFKRYYKTGTKLGKQLLKDIKAPVYFTKHHNIEYINKWYRLLGFELDPDFNIWIRRYKND